MSSNSPSISQDFKTSRVKVFNIASERREKILGLPFGLIAVLACGAHRQGATIGFCRPIENGASPAVDGYSDSLNALLAENIAGIRRFLAGVIVADSVWLYFWGYF
jgi:hypothetical protein